MNVIAPFPASNSVPVARLGQLAPLAASECRALSAAEIIRRTVPAHREIAAEGRPVAEPSMVVSGWACRSRIFADGRRQILGLLLPGDVIGLARQTSAIAATGIVALTEVSLCLAPRPQPDQAGLIEAYARSSALEEFYLFRQIGRLGRFNALERTVDLLLEIRERLLAVGIGSGDSFPLPLTQEMLADALGLTAVHVNRTLQTLRRDGHLDLKGGRAHLRNIDYLARLADYRPARVFVE